MLSRQVNPRPTLLVSILPYRLQYIRIPKRSVPAIAYALLKLILRASVDATFFSYAETDANYASLLVEESMFDQLKDLIHTISSDVHAKSSEEQHGEAEHSTLQRIISLHINEDKNSSNHGGLQAIGYPLRALRLVEGSDGYTDGGIVSSVSTSLADAGFSIFNISTNSADYVLVQEIQLESALISLRKDFALTLDVSEVTQAPTDENPAVNIPEIVKNLNAKITDDDLENPATTNHHGVSTTESDKYENDGSSNDKLHTTVSPLQLQVLPYQLIMYTLPKREREQCTSALLQLLFFPKNGLESPRFFAITAIETECTVILDTNDYEVLMGPLRSERVKDCMSLERWRCIEAVGTFAYDESGLVSAISGPLAEAGIVFFYFSTERTGCVLIQEQDIGFATSTLSEQFSFAPSSC